jgi:hypothetical protein
MNASRLAFCRLLLGSSAAVLWAAVSSAVPTLEISIGVRETGSTQPIGAPGGTGGGIEWVNLDGQTLIADGTWQTFTFDFANDPLTPFAGATANGVRDTTTGTLEHIRFRSTGDAGPWTIYIDDVSQTTSAGPTLLTGFEGFALGDEVMFQEPGFSGSTSGSLQPGSIAGISNSEALTGSQSYQLDFEWVDNDPSRWMRLTTFNTAILGNPTLWFADATGGQNTLQFSLLALGPDGSVPEPTNLVLLLLGLGAIPFARSRAR